jgi:hypothetical protein
VVVKKADKWMGRKKVYIGREKEVAKGLACRKATA